MMKIKGYKEEYKALLKMGLPVLLTQLGVILVSFADTMMVGAYGVDELAAAAFVNSLFVIPTVMMMGLAAGITPLVGALFGRGDVKEPGKVAKAGLQVNIIVAVAFTVIMGGIYFFLDCFGQPEELLPLIRGYYLILLCTLVPMSVFNTCQQVANGLTDTVTPMLMILLAVIINIIGNWILIYGHFGFPELGLNGAGIATLISRLTAMTGIVIILMRGRRYHKYKGGYKEAKELGGVRRKVWSTSYPIMIQNGIECSLWTFGAVACGWFGKIQLAAYQVVNTMGQLGFMTFMSFGTAVSIRVANYAGRGDEPGAGRAARAGVQMNMVMASIASVIFLALGRQIIHMFSPDEHVLSAGLMFLIPLVLYQYLDALQLTFINAIRGTSQVKPLLWIALVSYVAVGIPVLLLFSVAFGWEGVGVYYSFDVALLVAAVYAGIVFRRTHITAPAIQE